MPLFFVTLNTYKRSVFWPMRKYTESFWPIVERGLSLGAGVDRYVLMPDHIHLFVRLNPNVSLMQWVRNLKRSISASILEQAPHWQEGFFDHLLRGEESYAQKWEYVRQNLVRAGLTASHENWPYQGEIVPLRFD